MRAPDRATGLPQALEGIKAIGSLAGAAIILYVVYMFDSVLLDDAAAEAPGGYGGVVANEWLNAGLDTILPLTFLLLVFFGLVTRAIAARGALR